MQRERFRRFWEDQRTLWQYLLRENRRLRQARRSRVRVVMDARLLGLKVLKPLSLQELNKLDQEWRLGRR
jgi:hypothetical protein